MDTLWIVIIIIVILVILYLLFSKKSATTINCLSGMWLGEEEFCDDAGVDLMALYIDQDLKTCWLTIKSKTIDISHVGKIKIKNKLSSSKCTDKECEFTIEFIGLPLDIATAFASTQTIRYNTVTSRIRMYSDKDVYFQGYKDAKLSSLFTLE